MTIDIEQLRKDMEAGAPGDWAFCDDKEKRGHPFFNYVVGPVSTYEFGSDRPVLCYVSGGGAKSNARRIARLPELEREYLALREAADALAEAVENIDPDGAGVYEAADRAAAYRKATG